jgi:hypothetical protein
MKWFRNLFKKKKKSYPQNDKFKLCIVDENATYMHEILGITEERAEYLTRICLEAYDRHRTMHDCVAYTLDQCKHVNEVVFVNVVIYRIIDRFSVKDKIDNIIKNMFNND